MGELKQKLIERALSEYEQIFPCGSATLFDDCFTTTADKLLFWFNTKDESTHLLEEVLN